MSLIAPTRVIFCFDFESIWTVRSTLISCPRLLVGYTCTRCKLPAVSRDIPSFWKLQPSYRVRYKGLAHQGWNIAQIEEDAVKSRRLSENNFLCGRTLVPCVPLVHKPLWGRLAATSLCKRLITCGMDCTGAENTSPYVCVCRHNHKVVCSWL
jgi:hypothetical protein